MEKTTRSRILEKAFIAFSEKGYEGTNLRELAQALGITKTALYRHFLNKEDIWNCLIDEMEYYYDERIRFFSFLPETAEELKELTLRQVNFTLHDEKVVRSRKLITLEQYRDRRTAALATRHFTLDIAERFENIFCHLIEKGVLSGSDPHWMAQAYTAPITLQIHRADRESAVKEEAVAEITAFVDAFIRQFEIH